MMQQRSTTRLPDYWTHLDGSSCTPPQDDRLLDFELASVALAGQLMCDEHDRRVYPPDVTAEPLR